MLLYHATTPRKLARYRSSGRIITPVRGVTSHLAAQEWARKVGRTVILKIEGNVVHKLPDHHNQHGTAWWIEHDVETWEIVSEHLVDKNGQPCSNQLHD